jgi:hypothetical protein
MSRFAVLWIPLCLAGMLFSSAAPAAALEVKLHDGRRLHGVALRSADPASLRLLCGTPRAHIVFPVSWKAIATIVDGDRQWLPNQFEAFRKAIPARSESVKSRRALLGDSATGPESPPENSGERPSASSPNKTALRQASAWMPLPPAPISRAPGRVRMLEIDSWAANWDHDPEWDGIVVRIRPMDRLGQLVPASGTIDVVLEGFLPHQMPVYQSQRSVRPIGKWRKAVDRDDYGPDGAVLFLEFQNYRPERRGTRRHADQSIHHLGEVHARMTVAGAGVFPASAGTVRVRRFSPVRDQLFLERGTRFFQSE